MGETTARRWWQFRLSTLLLLMIMAGLAAGLWSQRQRSQQLLKAQEALQIKLQAAEAELKASERKLQLVTNRLVATIISAAPPPDDSRDIERVLRRALKEGDGAANRD
jgi:hypothetical protein